MKLIVLFLSTLILLPSSWAQNNYQSPLDIPLELAANFGELRPHHFHMGLDFKTKGKEGFNIRSIQDGYVSRIKVSRGGYGKMVQIAHPNGQSSVYAHCQSFKGAIDSLLQLVQTREQNEEVEIYLAENEIKVKRGQIIAISGNTGGSTAPHLHFELRDTKTEDALNPLLHGFFIADHIAPKMNYLKVSGLSKEGFTLPGKQISLPLKADKDGNYSLPTINLPNNFCDVNQSIGFSIDAIDQFDNSTNRCGIYQAELQVQNQKIFASQLDRISFEGTRDINCHMDHDEFLNGKDFHRLFITEENDLYNYSLGNGLIKKGLSDSILVKIILKDAKKNKSTLSFYLKWNGEKELTNEKKEYFDEQFYHPKETVSLFNKHYSIYFKEHTFYEPYRKSGLENSPWTIGSYKIPLQQSYDIVFKEKINPKSYLQVYSEKGKRKTEAIQIIGQRGMSNPINLGPIKILEDHTAPILGPLQLTGTMLKWKALDNETDIADYDLFIDGEWQILEYESKLDLLLYKRPSKLIGQHHFKIVLKDDVGNETIWEKDLSF